MALHTYSKYMYLLIERTFVEDKQIDEYYELAASEKIAVAMAEDWKRGYGAEQVAPNVLRVERGTGFGTTETLELMILSVPVVESIGKPTGNYVYVLVMEYGSGISRFDEWRAFMTIEEASKEMVRIADRSIKGTVVFNQNEDGIKTGFYTMIKNTKMEASAYIKKVAIHIL